MPCSHSYHGTPWRSLFWNTPLKPSTCDSKPGISCALEPVIADTNCPSKSGPAGNSTSSSSNLTASSDRDRELEPDAQLIDIDEFFDDAISSAESAVEAWLNARGPACIFLLWAIVTTAELLMVAVQTREPFWAVAVLMASRRAEPPARIEWLLICFVSVHALHRAVRVSVFVVVLLLAFFAISNALVLALLGGGRILATSASIAAYAHFAASCGTSSQFNSSNLFASPAAGVWTAAASCALLDCLIKGTSSNERTVLAGAHCLSFALYRVIGRFLEPLLCDCTKDGEGKKK
ncbi:hypothetical protein HDU83_005135 [Entophlyctis luteolus]|nr:hypothetical protein HDU83_005135 [Entophlyctis luteolus]KAJ3384652.1 hypothetical protein HDU84_002828 [Entophlyctis sp. JEL0112]